MLLQVFLRLIKPRFFLFLFFFSSSCCFTSDDAEVQRQEMVPVLMSDVHNPPSSSLIRLSVRGSHRAFYTGTLPEHNVENFSYLSLTVELRRGRRGRRTALDGGCKLTVASFSFHVRLFHLLPGLGTPGRPPFLFLPKCLFLLVKGTKICCGKQSRKKEETPRFKKKTKNK